MSSKDSEYPIEYVSSLNEVMRTIIVFAILVCALPCVAQSSGGIGPGGIGPVGIGPGKGSRDGHTLKHPVIQSKPEPAWPKIKNKVETTIVLRAIFRSDAKVTDVYVFEIIPKKPDGLSKDYLKELTKRAIDAAYQIKFIPGTRDGKPVSWRMQLEYLFRLDDEIKPSNQPPKTP
jgi:hypothetical protein